MTIDYENKFTRFLVGSASILTLAAGTLYLGARLGWFSFGPPKIEEDEASSEDEPATEFEAACKFVTRHVSTFPSSMKLKLYGLYKQVHCGDVSTRTQESALSSRGAMALAWASETGLSREQAEQKYVEILSQNFPTWRASMSNTTISLGISISNVVSRPEPGPGSVDTTQGGELAAWVVQGARTRILDALEKDPSCANARDKEGLTPLHWAADRGLYEICTDLLKFGADVGAQDDNGDTPLHLAAVAEQANVLELLISRGARSDVKNKDGETPEDATANLTIRKQIRRLFNEIRFSANKQDQ